MVCSRAGGGRLGEERGKRRVQSVSGCIGSMVGRGRRIPDLFNRNSSAAAVKLSSFPRSSKPTRLSCSLSSVAVLLHGSLCRAPVDRIPVHKADHAGEHLDVHAVHEEWGVFDRHLEEEGAGVFRGEVLREPGFR